ncbi:cupin domain-containing protein [Sphingomonas crusticola]|uniref:cupin domain-containing protein n=1 Tax=Sphingomonas crusticola TaxID=1697973 RepID=UPI000E22E728|nr:cupin domain-containing protein [Sphingomonas crusticola]
MKFASALLLAAAAPLSAQVAEPAGFATPADVQALVERIGAAMKPGQLFAMAPLVRAGVSVASVEYWKGPGRPAVHPTDAEYAVVVAGAGTLVSGGTMTDPEVTNPGLTQGGKIEGGISRPLAPGDVIMIPAGMPHWFGVSGGKLALLGIKLPQPARP